MFFKQVLFKHFASKNQLSGSHISGTLVENGLKSLTFQFSTFLEYFTEERFFPVQSKFQLFSSSFLHFITYPAKIYLFKDNNRNTRKSCEICSKLTTKKTFSSVSIVGF